MAFGWYDDRINIFGTVLEIADFQQFDFFGEKTTGVS